MNFKENGWINLDDCDLDLCLDADDLDDYLFENGFNGFYEDCEPPLDDYDEDEDWEYDYDDEDEDEDWDDELDWEEVQQIKDEILERQHEDEERYERVRKELKDWSVNLDKKLKGNK